MPLNQKPGKTENNCVYILDIDLDAIVDVYSVVT